MPPSTVCLSIFIVLVGPVSGYWWAVRHPFTFDQGTVCTRSQKLGARRQSRMCSQQPHVVQSIVDGVNMSLSECQYQMRHQRWNCSDNSWAMRRVLKWDTPESGYLHALGAAGGVYAVTVACSKGDLANHCNCGHLYPQMQAGRSQTDQWQWGGCDDDTRIARKKVKDFLDFENRYRDISTLIRQHNNAAGRLAVRHTMREACKCHGMSGSCAVKTCWLKMADFREVARHIRDRYVNATRVRATNDGNSFVSVPEKSQAGLKPNFTDRDIVFSERTPGGYCRPDNRYGALGTRGRICNVTSEHSDRCKELCCGRGYHRKSRYVLDDQCTLVGYDVRCKKTLKRVEVNTCK